MSVSETLDRIRECLQAIVTGPFVEDWEFSTLMGVERSEVADLLGKWNEADVHSEEVNVIVTNTLNTLLRYPHREDAALRQLLSFPIEDLLSLEKAWGELQGERDF